MQFTHFNDENLRKFNILLKLQLFLNRVHPLLYSSPFMALMVIDITPDPCETCNFLALKKFKMNTNKKFYENFILCRFYD